MQAIPNSLDGPSLLRPEDLAFQPREEISYRVFYPDLRTDEPLEVIENTYPELSGIDSSLFSYQPTSSYVVKTLPEAKVENIKVVDYHTDTLPPKIKECGYNTTTKCNLPADRFQRFIAKDPHNDNQFPVSYDLDELDAMWLIYYNEARASSDPAWIPLSHEFLEIMLTIIARHWLLLDAWIPKIEPVRIEDELDGRCVICNESDCETSNVIVFCDNCNMAVHQNCYGIPFVPEGQWFCKRCLLAANDVISCVCCPDRDGAFRTTVDGRWCHTVCAMAVPEISFHDAGRLDLVRDFYAIPKSRWKLICCVCKLRWGACVQCSEKSCYTAFHITCARRAGFYYKIHPPFSNYSQTEVECFCDKHTPPSHLEGALQRLYPLAVQYYRRMAYDVPLNYVACRAPSAVPEEPWNFRPLPRYIVEKVTSTLKELRLNDNTNDLDVIIIDICKYYQMKRKFRRDAPLLRSQRLADELVNLPVNAIKRRYHFLDIAKQLRGQYEDLLSLVELTARRQRIKSELSQLRKQFLTTIYFPLQRLIEDSFERICQLDTKGIFNSPLEHGWIGWISLKQLVVSYDIDDLFTLEQYLSHIWNIDGLIQSIDDMEQLTAAVQLAQQFEPKAKKILEDAQSSSESFKKDDRGNLSFPSLKLEGLECVGWPDCFVDTVEQAKLETPSEEAFHMLESFVINLSLEGKYGRFALSDFSSSIQNEQLDGVKAPEAGPREVLKEINTKNQNSDTEKEEFEAKNFDGSDSVPNLARRTRSMTKNNEADEP
ncbi:histone acetyltransferase complex subunit Nto1 [Schizosaccharomyces cryophilus OY26]|uniref:Histone acetyltransferase complex subunit Nto1 n=1 Tax=Schizosaccharomyces cryophilus (strain OY26 / ATCC MYA-4695 / CBS 11777 / NBRC 106824 / NRRL Y48691) TaxID=653667 RepID=S9XA76_SCHCR|nr:histone acetyltransferase complex subunit Nto1 [Schizosaccharomyces cryophilus OY26]EPY50671.1 histone acetyltransferase complex subunit Nto1 [Schizosaccharomyces cryophilus OY26]